MMENFNENRGYYWLMVCLTPIGGLSFPIVRFLLTVLAPFELLSYRLGLGAIALILLSPKSFFTATKLEIKGGLVSGLFFGSAMGLLVYGMQTTGGGQAAFILSTQVVMVPILRRLIWKEKFENKFKIAIGICFVGLVILTFRPDVGFRLADGFIFLAAFCVALFSISNSHFNSKPNVRTLPMGIWQIFSAGSGMFILANVTGNPSWKIPNDMWFALIFLILISTSFRYIVQLKLQSKLSATITGLIFTLEPVWATLFSFIWLKESMSLYEFLGSLIIFIGLFAAKSR